MNKVIAFTWLSIFILLGFIQAFLSPFIKIIAILLIVFSKGKYKQYGINVFEGYDNSVSSELLGDPDESLSSRLGKARIKGSNWSFIADKVDLVFLEMFRQKDHCNSSIENDEGAKAVGKY